MDILPFGHKSSEVRLLFYSQWHSLSVFTNMFYQWIKNISEDDVSNNGWLNISAFLINALISRSMFSWCILQHVPRFQNIKFMQKQDGSTKACLTNLQKLLHVSQLHSQFQHANEGNIRILSFEFP